MQGRPCVHLVTGGLMGFRNYSHDQYTQCLMPVAGAGELELERIADAVLALLVDQILRLVERRAGILRHVDALAWRR